MFIFYADKNKLTVRKREAVTSGSVNAYRARFEFSADWDGLERTAVFKAGTEERSVFLDDTNECGIPWEVLVKPGVRLLAGVYGTRGGEIVLPTVWESLGTILEGVSVPQEGSYPPTPELWQQELERKGDTLEYDGLNLTLMSGEKALSTVEIAGGGSVPVPGPEGPPGEDGKDGISPTVATQPINGGHEVIITDVDGPHVFNVMDGQDGRDGADGKEGPPGPAGKDGPMGPQGPAGADGAPGPAGPEGPAGKDGDPGPTGPQGEPGPTGPEGPQGPDGEPGKDGTDGESGATFTPAVSEEGVLSWTNDKGLPNPEPVSIKGPPGDAGTGEDTGEIYSTEEVRIGTWIDGKPLYRRVFEANIPTQLSAWITINPVIDDINPYIVNAYSLSTDTNYECEALPTVAGSGANIAPTKVMFVKGSGVQIFNSGSWYVGRKCITIVYYGKDADSTASAYEIKTSSLINTTAATAE